MTMALEGGEGSVSRPGCSGKDPVPIVQVKFVLVFKKTYEEVEA